MPKITVNMKRIGVFSVLFLLCAVGTASAEVTFSKPDLAEFNTLLFSAATDSPGFGSYTTLFSADLDTNELTQHTFFPENILYLKEVEKLQIQNRYGVFRTGRGLSSPSPVAQFSAFVGGDEIQTGKINPVAASPDGRYLLYVEPISYGYADLMLYDISQEKEIKIAEEIERTLDGPNALWAPDSQFFIYAKQNNLYYYSIDQLKEGRVIAEEFRRIGKGKISSVQWNEQNNLFYVADSLVYQIFSAELFTRSIYSGLFEIGTIVGKIPFRFDPNFDSFWISPDGRKILLNKGGRNIFFYFMQNTDYTTTGEVTSLPYLFLPRNTQIERVLWSGHNLLTILTGSIVEGKETTTVFRLDLGRDPDEWGFVRMEDRNVQDIVLSPDDRRAALILPDRVLVKKYVSWEDERSFSYRRPVHAVWKSAAELIIAGSHRIEEVSLLESKKRLIGFSQADEYGFGRSSRYVQVKIGEGAYEFDPEQGAWEEIASLSVGEEKVYSEDYRVFIERIYNGSYRNIVMVRDNQGLSGTKSLFDPPEKSYEPFPDREEPVNFLNFTHGSRIRRREVALVFNAIDSVEGLTLILNTLADYDVRATFFVNGEFIRRHPDAVKEIAYSGHEIGSLFYTYFNMTDSRFTIDKEFIKRGLARNEDDYFLATGRELSVLWHAPYYFVNTDIIEASREMNYTYIGRDIDPLDWVTQDAASGARGGLYYPSSVLIERVIVEKEPGSIIPIRIGKTDGRRDDYLFHKIDLLLNGLISLGYTAVPVSTLIEHAR